MTLKLLPLKEELRERCCPFRLSYQISKRERKETEMIDNFNSAAQEIHKNHWNKFLDENRNLNIKVIKRAFNRENYAKFDRIRFKTALFNYFCLDGAIEPEYRKFISDEIQWLFENTITQNCQKMQKMQLNFERKMAKAKFLFVCAATTAFIEFVLITILL